MKRSTLILLSVLVAVAVIVAAGAYRYINPPAVVTTQPATAPLTATLPTTDQTPVIVKKERGPATQILDILHANNPKYPTTAPLDSALDLKYSAHAILSDPVYLDTMGYLWITRRDAPEKIDFAKAGSTRTATIVTRERPAFVLWAQNDSGKPVPHLICYAADGYEMVDYDGRRALPDPHGFDWKRGLTFIGSDKRSWIVVPTRGGVCAFRFDQTPQEVNAAHVKLAETDDAATQLTMDPSGVLAWVTNKAGTRGGKGFASAPKTNDVDTKVDFVWTRLTPENGWPEGILHLVPLLDGSVLRIVSGEGDAITFSLGSIDTVKVDEKRVLELIDQLSDDEQSKRDAAFAELALFGPGIAAILEKALDEQPAEAKIRIRQLMKNRVEPKLGNMSLTDGTAKVMGRYPDGGVLFYAEQGVAIPRIDDTPTYIAPAWLSVRPGRVVTLLPDALTAELQPGKQRVVEWGGDQIVFDDLFGPQYFIGNRLDPLLKKSERRFNEFVGRDWKGRWIFRSPPTVATVEGATKPITIVATTATAATVGVAHTLIIDPWLPDPTPRMPAWELPLSAGKVGWDKDHWPVVYMDVDPKKVPWALMEGGWRVIEEEKEKVYLDLKEMPAKASPATTRAATTTQSATTQVVVTTTQATAPATTQAATLPADLGEPILIDDDGSRYFDGRQSLKVLKPDGTLVIWTLPEMAVGTGQVTLLHTREDRLFLFNEPGRIVRIRPMPDDVQPFEVEAVFTKKVPSDPNPQRIWLDPAGRICIAYGGNRLTVLFPIGRIPPGIAEKMPAEEERPDE